jgi:tRNA pseudouridine38-40 synthase
LSTRNIRLTLAYDGSEFCGWQVQANGRTVQGVIEEALARMHGHPVRIQGAGRTDTGVHATGQVANFHSDLDSIEAGRWCLALNSYLPHDVRALESREADPGFNAKDSARLRAYTYYLYPARIGPPHIRRYCWKIDRRPDLAALNRLAAVFLGEHDFTTFAAAGDPGKGRARRVVSACFHPEGRFLVFRIAANSFVWKMVRSILGTMLEYEKEGRSPAELGSALAARDRSRAGTSAPARGLFLERVVYDDEPGYPA